MVLDGESVKILAFKPKSLVTFELRIFFPVVRLQNMCVHLCIIIAHLRGENCSSVGK